MNLTDVMCCGQRMAPSPSADELKCGRCGSVVTGSDIARFDRQIERTGRARVVCNSPGYCAKILSIEEE